MRTRIVNALLVLGLLLLPACATLPSHIAKDPVYIVAFKSARLPDWMPWYSTFAEHGWFDVRTESGWTRVEVMGRTTGVLLDSISDTDARADYRWGGRQVHVSKLYEGESARELAYQILAKAKQFPHADNYEPVPGPNSNTFTEWLSKEVPGLWIEQYGTAVGKDYPMNGWVAAGVTSTRTGLELETPFLGVQAGLVEGVELHLFSLTIGVGLWPPRLKLPFLPGLPWELAR